MAKSKELNSRPVPGPGWKVWKDDPPPDGTRIEANLGPAKLGYLGIITDPRRFERIFFSLQGVMWREMPE